MARYSKKTLKALETMKSDFQKLIKKGKEICDHSQQYNCDDWNMFFRDVNDLQGNFFALWTEKNRNHPKLSQLLDEIDELQNHDFAQYNICTLRLADNEKVDWFFAK